MMGSSEWSKTWCDGALLQLANLSSKSLPRIQEDSMNAGHCARPTAHDGAIGPSAEKRRGSSVGCAPCQRQRSLEAGRLLQGHAAQEAGRVPWSLWCSGQKDCVGPRPEATCGAAAAVRELLPREVPTGKQPSFEKSFAIRNRKISRGQVLPQEAWMPSLSVRSPRRHAQKWPLCFRLLRGRPYLRV